MAGLLSKGITLACRGFTGGVRYKHEINVSIFAENTTLTLYNDSPESLAGVHKDATKLIGASDVEKELIGSVVMNGVAHYLFYSLIGNEVITEQDANASDTLRIVSDVVTVERNSGGNAWVDLTNLQEIAELGNNAREKIDVTTLDDDEKKYIDGLADTAQDLAFKFLYDKEQFAKLAAMEGVHEWRVTLPDGATATFNASPSVKIAGAGVSAGIFYTLTLSLTSKVVFA